MPDNLLSLPDGWNMTQLRSQPPDTAYARARNKATVATSPILVPWFPRIEDLFGEWAYEPARFAALWRLVSRTDLPAHMAAPLPPKPQTLTEMVPAKGGKTVAVLKATGTLMKAQSSFGGTSTVQLRKELRAATADPNVSAILLAVDSPGGTVAGTEALAGDVRRARKAKPTWAFIDDLGASAAYWVASQAGQVFAGSPTTLVGSIGTILTIQDSADAAERAGVKTIVFSTGPLKGAGTPGTPVTDDQRAHFQGLVNGLQTSFDAGVKAGRQMNQGQLDAVRSGGTWPAAEALGLKLIDGIQSIDKTIDMLAAVK